MARLPSIDLAAFWIRDMLNRGDREAALARIAALVESGKAGAGTRALADYFAKAGRGRQPFGAAHRWMEIGAENDIMRGAGVSHAERVDRLAEKYHLADVSKIKTAIATWERAMETDRRGI